MNDDFRVERCASCAFYERICRHSGSGAFWGWCANTQSSFGFLDREAPACERFERRVDLFQRPDSARNTPALDRR